MKTRTEHDLLGDKEIPADAYYGVQTARAQENFHISGITMMHFPRFIVALAKVKKAAALANHELRLLSDDQCRAICAASDELIAGKLHDHFVVDMIQGGAGTSANMNANEVIANRGLEILGHAKGDYQHLHPNNHVNLSQSTNDAYPTAINIALYAEIECLLGAMDTLQQSFLRKAGEFKDVIKMGRTQLQDAVPITLGQEFNAYATGMADLRKRMVAAREGLFEMNMGATAIGTGINTHPDYAAAVERHLREVTGHPYTTAADLIEATQNTSGYVQVSGMLNCIAARLSKICNDLRLLSSGPRTGFNEINLPAMQPGSSIMPGKVNPVIPEVVNQVCFQLMGLNTTITVASEAGQLQLNVFEPIIAYNLFSGVNMLTNAMHTLAGKCVDGITANPNRCRELVLHSIGLVTALSPFLGYENATGVAKEALETGGSVYDIVLARDLLSLEQLGDIIKPENMIKPRIAS